MSFESILQFAFNCFERSEYKEAIKGFMAAYVSTEDEEIKNEIFNMIFKNFIEPNDEEFKMVYIKNIDILKKNGCLNDIEIPSYEDLALYMIPVSDNEYFVWNKEEKIFWRKDSFIISSIEDKGKKLFDSIIIDNCSDLREYYQDLYERMYSHFYIVLNNEMMLKQFFSFFIIPDIKKIITKNLHIFSSKAVLKKYLITSNNYIPKTIKGEYVLEYKDLLTDIHNKRIKAL